MAKGSGENESQKQGQRVMFVSLFMILLAFFILLNSIASIHEERKKEALKSLGGAFGQLPRGTSLYDSRSGNPNPPAVPIRGDSAVTQLLSQVRNVFTGKMGQGVEVKSAPGGRGVMIRIEAPAVFPGDSTGLSAEFEARLRRVADLAKEAGTGVVVRGHTSLQVDKGLKEAWWISGRRAQNVLRVFHEAGVATEAMRMNGLGDLEPGAAETTAAGQRRNERVEILLKLEEESQPKPLFPGGEPAAPIAGPPEPGNG
jgi:chemotaxis protein MotB